MYDLKDFCKLENWEVINFFINVAYECGIENVYVWDYVFYFLDYYFDCFKVEVKVNEDFIYYIIKFEGGL